MPDADAIVQAVQDLGYDSTLDAVQLRWVNQFYRNVNGMRRWPWTEGTATIALTTGSQTVSLASVTDLVQFDSVEILDGTDRSPLTYISPEEWVKYVEGVPQTGTPEVWTYKEGSLKIFPAPDAIWDNAVIHYKKDLADLTGSDEPAWPETFHDILVFGAAANSARRERDWEAVANFEAQYRERVAEMRNQIALRQKGTTGHVNMDWANEMRGHNSWLV